MTGLPDPTRIAGHGELALVAGAALTPARPPALALALGPLSGTQIVAAIAVIAVVSVVLWIPVLWDRLTAFLSLNAPKWAPRMFVAGLALLVTGLTAGLHIVAIVGGCTIGVLAASMIYDNY